MLVDHERVLLNFEAYVASKPSHGRSDLLTKLAELRAQHALEEGLPEEAIRLFGNKLSVDLLSMGRSPADADSHRVDAMAQSQPDHRIAATEQHGGSHEHTRSAAAV